LVANLPNPSEWKLVRLTHFSSTQEGEKTMPNAITLLKSDHVTVKRLLRELDEATEEQGTPGEEDEVR
jgi:hypothetical protein